MTAVDKLAEWAGVTGRNTVFRQDQVARVAIQFPSLAAVLAKLLGTNGHAVPTPWRHAAQLMEAYDEQVTGGADTRAVAGMGACASCGHVQAQHGERGCYQCTVCQGWQSTQPLGKDCNGDR